MVNVLLKWRANAVLEDSCNLYTPLHLASRNGHVDVVQVLLAYKLPNISVLDEAMRLAKDPTLKAILEQAFRNKCASFSSPLASGTSFTHGSGAGARAEPRHRDAVVFAGDATGESNSLLPRAAKRIHGYGTAAGDSGTTAGQSDTAALLDSSIHNTGPASPPAASVSKSSCCCAVM